MLKVIYFRANIIYIVDLGVSSFVGHPVEQNRGQDRKEREVDKGQ